jgi:response regulator RpfG family c-di-GMP phosphodiesterase
MAKRKADVPEAPSCVHDEMEAYFVAGSPGADAFAAGMFRESDLLLPELDEATPWRRGDGWIATLAGQQRPRSTTTASPPGRDVNPESLADPKHVQHDQEVDRDRQESSAEDVPFSEIHVLVVHPNLGTRKQVSAILGQAGMQVSTCGQTEQAILQVLHERPDAVLAELDVPGFDALALCRTLHDRVPEIPVLVVAPGDDEGSYSLAMEAGAADYIRRPVTPPFVSERLRIAVAHARSGSRAPQKSAAPAATQPEGGTQFLSRELRRQELKIQSLFELSKNVVGCLELDELYQGFLLNAMGQLGLSSGVLFHLDSSGRVLEIVCRGVSRRETRRLLDFRAGLGLYLLRAPQPLLLEEQIFPRELGAEVLAVRDCGFGVACPMAAKGSSVGVALFGSKVSGLPFTADDLVMLTAVCNFAGPALEGARLYSELHRTYLSTVRAFVSSLEAKDTYTRGHSERVADYARVLGQTLGLGRHEIDMLVFGAVLHDIGKIGVAEGILNKPGPLTPEEWRVVRAHPEMGARIISNIDYLEPAVGLILHHHERIDGRGYPHGLVGRDIELGTRIVTVVDSFDAMTTDRPYRQAMGVEKAITLLRGNAGRQFDPKIVERFIDLIQAGAIALRV